LQWVHLLKLFNAALQLLKQPFDKFKRFTLPKNNTNTRDKNNSKDKLLNWGLNSFKVSVGAGGDESSSAAAALSGSGIPDDEFDDLSKPVSAFWYVLS
jgi:hypothetical protein